jgi:hypothetical protein
LMVYITKPKYVMFSLRLQIIVVVKDIT